MGDGPGRRSTRGRGYLDRFGARWLRALAAAVLEAAEVRPSRSTFDAAEAAFGLVFRDAMSISLLVGQIVLICYSLRIADQRIGQA